MKTVGQILREARENKGLSVAQAAEGTHSKSQVILALEQDDYSRFPAPIYTRGFIKLYAELLGLDAPELISLYQARNSESDKLHRPASVLKPGSSHTAAPPPNVTPELDLAPPPPSVPEPPAPAPAAPVLPSAPVTPELELPFDQPISPPKPAPAPAAPPVSPPPPAPRPFPKPVPLPPLPPPPPKPVPPPPKVQPPPAAEPPKVAPILPEAPSRPVSAPERPPPPAPAVPKTEILPPPAHPAVPRVKATIGKPAASAEFDLAVPKDPSSVARQRAASILATAQASAGRLPWRKILIRTAVAVCAGLLIWMVLSLFRGCGKAPAAVPPGVNVSPVPHAVPEPPPLYFPESTPGR